LKVNVNGVDKGIFSDNAILGRNALDGEIPRTATLQATKPSYILMLHRYDYQQILNVRTNL